MDPWAWSARTLTYCRVAMHHNSGVRNGKRPDVDCCMVFELKNSRVPDGRE